jgi:hypothetical protein
MMFFSLQCVLASTIGYTSYLVSLPSRRELLTPNPSMISFQISPVIPTDTLWFAMLFLVGMLGLTGQVCSLVLSFSSAGLDPQQL